MFSRLESLLPGRPVLRAGRRLLWFLRARYDAALTSDNNRRHWANADGLSANAANSPEVRRVLRNRRRYEVANNSCARGVILTLAYDRIPAKAAAYFAGVHTTPYGSSPMTANGACRRVPRAGSLRGACARPAWPGYAGCGC